MIYTTYNFKLSPGYTKAKVYLEDILLEGSQSDSLDIAPLASLFYISEASKVPLVII
jgi:hypothetical protein